MMRGDDMAASMSRYLVDRINSLPNVEVVTRAQVTALEGRDGALEAMRWRKHGVAEEMRCDLRHLFLFIGAEPETTFLSACEVELDKAGFVVTGRACALAGPAGQRAPLESSIAGIFAVGDVRSGSVKRVGGAIGEGAAVVAAIHEHLARVAAN